MNEAFLADMLKNKGGTNLGDYYLRRVREKEEANSKHSLSNVMIPPSLLGNAGGLGYGGANNGLGNSFGAFSNGGPLGGANSNNGLQNLIQPNVLN